MGVRNSVYCFMLCTNGIKGKLDMAFLLIFFAKFLLYLIIKKEYLMIFNMELRNFGKKYIIHKAKKSQNQFGLKPRARACWSWCKKNYPYSIFSVQWFQEIDTRLEHNYLFSFLSSYKLFSFELEERDKLMCDQCNKEIYSQLQWSFSCSSQHNSDQ